MPGTFSHMLAADTARLAAEAQGLDLIARCTLKFPQWLQAGTVGPDYPYLHHLQTGDKSESWADLMHYERSGDVVRAGVEWLSDWPGDRESKQFQRAVAWLSGYLAHVILDVSIHPVVRATVGEYAENKKEHRICEMTMDSFIFKDLLGTELVNDEWADYLRHTSDDNGEGMDQSIKAIWGHMLKTVYPQKYAQQPPAFDGWHKGYVNAIDLADNKLILFRHAATDNGLMYADSKAIPKAALTKYVEKAKTPQPNRFGAQDMHYRDIFKFGVDNIVEYWAVVNAALEGEGDISMPSLANWNLDTGTTDPAGEGDATLWV